MGVRIEIHICPLSFFCYCYSLKFLHVPTTMIIWSIIFLSLLVGSIILVGFHGSVFSDIKLCVLEELWRSGIGLWFEREGQIEPHSHQRQHLEQKSFLPTHWVSGFQMDLGHTFVFVISPSSSSLHSPPSFQRNLRMGFVLHCLFVSFFNPTLSISSTNSDQQWQTFSVLWIKGETKSNRFTQHPSA